MLNPNKKEQAKTCSIHKLNTMKKHKKIECSPLKSVMNTRNGGQGWIRTTEVVDGRFTVCSLWPLGNLPLLKNWSWWTDSNPRPADYKSAALPTELHQRLNA